VTWSLELALTALSGIGNFSIKLNVNSTGKIKTYTYYVTYGTRSNFMIDSGHGIKSYMNEEKQKMQIINRMIVQKEYNWKFNLCLFMVQHIGVVFHMAPNFWAQAYVLSSHSL
jgi:hypothetical protein